MINFLYYFHKGLLKDYTIDSDVLPLGATNVIYEVNWEDGSLKLWAFTRDLVVRFFEVKVMREKNSFRLEDFVRCSNILHTTRIKPAGVNPKYAYKFT